MDQDNPITDTISVVLEYPVNWTAAFEATLARVLPL